MTGASGHIGANLVRALLARGRRVRAVVHRSVAALEGLDVEQVRGDIRAIESLRAAVAGCEAVYHAAGFISISGREDPRLDALNVQGARNVARACLDAGVGRLVHFSSLQALVDTPHDTPVDEARPRATGPERQPYDRSKAASEAAVRELVAEGLDAVVVHPTGVLGPWDFGPSPMGQVLADLAARRIPALLRGGTDWVDARDVAAGAVAAEARGRRGESYLLGGRYATLRELADTWAEVTGVRAPRITSPLWLAKAAAPFSGLAARARGREPRFTRASLAALSVNPRVSHAKAARELGYAPRPLRETLEDTWAWIRARSATPG